MTKVIDENGLGTLKDWIKANFNLRDDTNYYQDLVASHRLINNITSNNGYLYHIGGDLGSTNSNAISEYILFIPLTPSSIGSTGVNRKPLFSQIFNGNQISQNILQMVSVNISLFGAIKLFLPIPRLLKNPSSLSLTYRLYFGAV